MPRCLSDHFRLAVAVLGGSLLLHPGNASAVLPLPTYPSCGADDSVQDCPPDLVREDGTLSGDSFAYIHYIPEPLKRNIRRQEWEMGAGSSTTLAWQKSTGRFDVTLAVLDCGIRWKSSALANKVALNTGELPLPRRADGTTCGSYDCDGNGLINIQDYRNDARISITSGVDSADHLLDPSDLIYTFSDRTDADQNGFIDDIAGWDFFWNDNDPYTTNDFYHMTSVLEEAAGEGGELDSVIGHCPNCSILPVRISDSFVGEGDKISEGIVYAADRGVKVIGMALGSMTNPQVLQDAMQYAWEKNVTVVAAAGDELGYHHNFPGANDHSIYVHSIKYYPTISLETARTVLGFFGCNNFGARLDAVATSNACATGSTAATTGMAGLVISRALDQGISLSSAEVRQLLLRTTDDINVAESRQPGSAYFPSYPGWDQFFGYGRVNSGRAVNAVTATTIPPEIEISSPHWFQYIDPRITSSLDIQGRIAASRAPSYRYEVAWAPGGDPRDADFLTLSSRSNLTSPTTGTLATFNLSTIDPELLDARAPVETLEGDETVEARGKKINARSITLRIRAWDSRNTLAEERKYFYLVEDPDLLSGFPKRVGYSLESSPILYDLDGDGALEILQASSSGVIHALRSNGTELPGWPVHTGLLPGLNSSNSGNHLGQPASESGAMSTDVRQGIVGTLAVGDLEGDGSPEVVAATLEGYLYAFGATGSIKTGFPVMRDPATDAETSPMIWRDPGMFSSTVLFDLDSDGRLEIIQASMDQKVYVWRYNGQRQPGFPVRVENPDGSTGVTTVAGRIVSSPAVGDLDDDGDYEIVVGTNEYDDEKSFVGFAYAIQGTGTNYPGGAIVPGWPVPVVGILSGVINYIGEGVTPSPSLADVDRDGTLEVALSGVGSFPVLLRADGTEAEQLGINHDDFGRGTNSNDHLFWTVVNNTAFSDFDGGGDVELLAGGSGMSYFESLGLSRYMKFDHLATVWKTRTGKMLDAFPRVTEDISFFNAPAAADVTGDGNPEMLVGTSGYILHAFQVDGSQSGLWPKFTGGWLIASPAVGDIDGDGRNEVVVGTREGYLFAWNTNGIGEGDWPMFRHDPQNTGNYEVEIDLGRVQAWGEGSPADAPQRDVPAAWKTDALSGSSTCSARRDGGGHSAPSAGVLLLGLAAASVLTRRRISRR